MIAKELARKATGSMPDLLEGEAISREWYEDGKYYRETSRATYAYDFRLKECAEV
jgi:hypothetical protein